jgi:S-adenosylmethionine-diacylgycerolhomoserine-N-methlytransferase
LTDAARAEHRAFLNRYYGASRLFYDATRKHYLFGRDPVLRDLARDRTWRTLAEVGPGTGRNLARLRRARPDATLGGVEACDAMLAHARARCPWAVLEHGFAEDAPIRSLFGAPPDVVLFSYCLSMVGDRAGAVAHARRALAPGGRVVVVDFGDFGGLPRALAEPLRSYLRAFRVEPLGGDVLADAASVQRGPGSYYVVATFSAAPS